jgi:hypothetical protein
VHADPAILCTLELNFSPLEVITDLHELGYGLFVHLPSLTVSQLLLSKVPKDVLLGGLSILHFCR